MTKSKKRRGVALGAALLMIILEILAVKGDGFQLAKAGLALLLAILAGGFIAWDFKIPKKLSPIVFLALPAAALCCMEFFTHVPWDLTPLIFFLNYLFYLVLYLIVTAVSGNMRWGAMLTPVFPALAGTVNYFVVSFRSSPIVPWDLYSLRTAASVADNYTLDVSWRLYFVLMGFLWLAILGEKMRFPFGNVKKRLLSVAVSLVLMFAFVSYVQTENCEEIFGLDDILFTPNVLYRNNGFMVAYLANLQYLHIEKPQGYSTDAAQKIAEETSVSSGGEENHTDKTDMEDQPNILVIMNEAFSDLSVYGDFNTTEDYMPFWRSLKKNTVRGNLYVSVKGGNTANTEFEFLTGLSMYFLPTGSIPYQQYIKSEVPSLASQLSSIGYTSVSMHPYYPKGWNRDTVYDDLGFEEKYFKDDFSNPEILRTYISDWTTYQKIISRYEEKSSDERLFVFDVTMQNHGSYVKRYSNFIPDVSVVGGSGTYLKATEQYLSLIKRSDEAFKQLVEYFEKQSEPTIIMMFGDHQPADYITNVVDTGKKTGSNDAFVTSIGTGSDRKERYIVPFVMWANYDINESQGEETSANYMAVRLLKAAGLPLTDFQSYLSDLQQNVPFISAHALKENTGTDCGEEEAEALLKNYKKLLYNDLFDTKHRLQAFYSYE